MARESINNPAFGLISISRISASIGGKRGYRLFQSPLDHHHFLEICISGAELQRENSRDWAMARDEKIRVWLSEAQFGRFITSAGMGSGVPCTISRFNGQMIPEIPVSGGTKETFDKELKKLTKDVANNMKQAVDKLNALLDKPRTTKGELTELKDLLASIKQNIECNIPYIENSFEESLDAAVQDAKTEIEAHVTNTLIKKGLDKAILGESQTIVALPEGKDENS